MKVKAQVEVVTRLMIVAQVLMIDFAAAATALHSRSKVSVKIAFYRTLLCMIIDVICGYTLRSMIFCFRSDKNIYVLRFQLLVLSAE